MKSWIRGPVYDGVFVLSGLPLGAALVLLMLWAPSFFSACPSEPTSVMFLMPRPSTCDPVAEMGKLISIYAVVLLDMGHNIAPICLAWTHRGFRQIMLARPGKFIVFPLVLLVLGTCIGIYSVQLFPEWTPFVNSAFAWSEIFPPRYQNPFWWLVAVYAAWNYFHFGKQNFGILSIYRRKSESLFPPAQRRLDQCFAFVVQTAVLLSVLIPMLPAIAFAESAHLIYFGIVACLVLFIAHDAAITRRWWSARTIFALSQSLPLLFPGMMIVAANGINHWLVSIGLAAHIAGAKRRWVTWVFAGAVTVGGIILGGVFFHKSGMWTWHLRDMIVLALPYAGFRLALGFVHFLYDRYLYQFSRPDVRAAIGCNLFTPSRPGVVIPFPAIAE